MMRKVFSRIFVFFFSILVVSAASGFGQADEGDDVRELLVRFSTPNLSSKDRSNLALQLKDYPYREVKKALLNAFTDEVSKGKPNSYILGAILQSLEKLANPSDVTSLQSALPVLRKIQASWRPYTETQLLSVIAKAASRDSQELPSLQNVSANISAKTTENFFDGIRHAIAEGKINPALASTFLIATERCISDDIAEILSDPRNPRIIGRENEAISVLDILVRIKGRVPVLVGEAGVGKTAIAEAIAFKIREGDLPPWENYAEEFPKGTVVVETSPARIGRLALSDQAGAQAAALESYIEALRYIEKAFGRKVILFIDEIHTLQPAQLNALKAPTERVGGISLIGATTHSELRLLLKFDRAMERRITEIRVRELSDEQTFDVLKKGWIRQVEDRYRITISDEVLRQLIAISRDVNPDRSNPDAQIKFIQDLAIRISRENLPDHENPLPVTETHAREFAGEVTGLPVNPSHPHQLVEYLEKGRAKVLKNVVGQEHLVDLLVKTWQQVLTSKPEQAAKTVVLLGSTGTGKSLLGETLAEVFLGSRELALVIDATAYMTGEHSLNSLIGAPNGVISSDETSGVLPEFLSGRGKYAGVIVINEFDKAHRDFARRIMEMMDRKQLTGGDGKIYRTRRHLIILTTNRGSDIIFNRQFAYLVSKKEALARVQGLSEAEIRNLFIQSRGYESFDSSRLPPEIVNRIDRWGVAMPLFFEDALQIAQMNIERFVEEIRTLHKLTLKIDPEVSEWIAKIAFTPSDGARPIKQRVESILSRVVSLVWSQTDTVERKEIRVVLKNSNQENVRLQVIDEEMNQPLGEISYEEPVRFMAIKDPRFYEILEKLEENIESEIFGLDTVIEQMASIARSRVMRPFDTRPMVYGFFGPTGTGKTELAKVFAKYLYGSRERAHIFEFGKIQHRFDLSNIFNPPKGVVGSGEPSPFQQLLETFPDGGVMVFDEISNMGKAATPGERQAMFQYLYGILDEGKWTNELGRTYDLSKWTIVMTGNDGEELFQNTDSEDLANAIWDEYQDREALKKLLMKRGMPEAFVNRIGALFLFRPIPREHKRKIVEKFLNAYIEPLEAAHGIKIKYRKGFSESVARAFFPFSDGGRGARRFVEQDLLGRVSDFIFRNYARVQEGNVTLIIGLEINLPEKPWAVLERTETECLLKIQAQFGKGSDILTEEKKVKPTSFPRLTLLSDARNAAIHEGGHALVNLHLGEPNGPLVFLTIESGEGFGGYARYDGKEAKSYRTLDTYIKAMATALGGSMAQQMKGLPKDSGWAQDLHAVRRMATEAVVDLGLVEGLEFIRTDPSGKLRLDADTSRKVTEEATKLVQQAIDLARSVLSDPEVQKQSVQLETSLLERGSLTGDDVLRLIGPYRISFPADSCEKLLLGNK